MSLYIYGIELSSEELRHFFGKDVKEILSNFITLGLYKYGIETYVIGGVVDERNIDGLVDDICNKIITLDIQNSLGKSVGNNRYLDSLKRDLDIFKDDYTFLRHKRENRYVLPHIN